jgi:cation diffusion facilitator family transporter
MVQTVPARHSRAAMRNAARGGGRRVIVIALTANLVVAIAKLIAGLVSGSVALLAEAGHSFADSLNQILLGVSLGRGGVPADARHPFGHGRERFLWAFFATMTSFLVGGCLSIGLAIWKLAAGGPNGDVLIAWVVLVVAFAADGTSFVQSLRQSRLEAEGHGLPLVIHLLRSSDPVLRAVVVEDGAGLIGVVLAAGGLLLSNWVGSGVPDAIASLLIGILLAISAVGLAQPLVDFLVGRSLPTERLRQVHETIVAAPGIEAVLVLRAIYVGPDEVIIAAKVRPTTRLTVRQLTEAMDALDVRLHATFPEVADVFLDVTTFTVDVAQPAPAKPRRTS